MIHLHVQPRNAPARTFQTDSGCSIGKDPACDIVLKGMLIGKLHARVIREHNAWYIEDQGGILATLVNGSPVTRYGPLLDTDQIEIGTTVLRIVAAPAASPAVAVTTVAAPAPEEATPLAFVARVENTAPVHALPVHASPPTTPASIERPIPVSESARPASLATQPPSLTKPSEPPRTQFSRTKRSAAPALEVSPINSPNGIELRKRAHMKVIATLDLRRLNVSRMEDDELRRTVNATLDDILGHDTSLRSPDIPLEVLKKSVFDEIIGLGPLEELLADASVSEIMVNCHDEVFVEQHGRLTRSPVVFTDDRAVIGAIERIVAPIGRRIDESSPMVDARLPDGSRVNAVIPPLSLKGPSITIRKFSKRKLTGEDLIQYGSMSPDMLEFLRTAVEQRANIVISGGTGSGKTTLLNVLSGYIPDDERIVTVEDAAELQLSQPNLVSLEARPANMEGKGAIPIRDLVKNCLRMRPDRIVVGECRGGEALDMLQAMNTGHDGSLTTTHANAPRDCIARLEVMTLMAGLDLPAQAIREQICSAVDIIVQQSRFSCGSRRVTHVTEVNGMESGVIQLQDVFIFKEEGFGIDGRIQGEFVSTAYIPDFYQDLIRRRIPVNTDIFTRTD
ncbi:ATPase, T2SS/T4P/T4SS family [Paraburkholderia gardini]|uniref:FHA domain-containing protein n=1 Tax=Paraburkholderia gardini TaxID=2823469 RepID=A0ABN7QM49_9BURK|nr:ATPase, T2SS/T4P/T4SS family [Paraburkholderia gardini]CAG4898171.1 hypothetical protein R69919_02427 [Paraburkholderia gardini]CAG4898654.1 hypothetical protein R54767_02420 [Paraburkholderia gardini]